MSTEHPLEDAWIRFSELDTQGQRNDALELLDQIAADVASHPEWIRARLDEAIRLGDERLRFPLAKAMLPVLEADRAAGIVGSSTRLAWLMSHSGGRLDTATALDDLVPELLDRSEEEPDAMLVLRPLAVRQLTAATHEPGTSILDPAGIALATDEDVAYLRVCCALLDTVPDPTSAELTAVAAFRASDSHR